ncbi:MAG: ABC transporter ATP-binding protein [Candidatus Micrarchaeota archaeon]|nr:ABC transporter ATP-binding protein [Candidatus Micrarchaeota archaeon]MDE1834009.1 ABC transporter ATP-binding protein [Candidatus Micrarchaeota archaeon]MDE1859482.1 ABC transporter ATP-binding protein [Candidatus Micrarchaeota archaeon]
MKTISVENVAYFYEDSQREVIDSVSFSVNRGEFVSIIGPSGCGKSTLLRIISGLIPPSRGKVMFMGREITGPNRKLSFVFQDFALFPWLTNLENVELGLSFSDVSDDAKDKKASELLDRFGLGGFEKSYPNVLSGGMKQRVGIARAVASDPQVLLMDEPFSSLDELTAETLRSDIVYMLENKNISVNTVIMVTHNVEEAVELSDRVVVLSNKPTVVKKVIQIRSKRPRDKKSGAFSDVVDQIYATLAK